MNRTGITYLDTPVSAGCDMVEWPEDLRLREWPTNEMRGAIQ